MYEESVGLGIIDCKEYRGVSTVVGGVRDAWRVRVIWRVRGASVER